MYILALETTGPHASVALTDERGNMTELVNGGTLNHLENIVPMVKECLEKVNITVRDISCIACSAGPGSFTGIRIGVTTARALAQFTGCEVIPVETLKSFAYGAEGFDGLICPVIDARRGQCYAAGYTCSGGRPEEVIKAGPYGIEELLSLAEKTGKKCLFYGDGAVKYADRINDMKTDTESAAEEDLLQRAGYVAKAGLAGYMNGEAVSYGKLEPVYMRKAEAERKREEKIKNESAGN